MLCHNRHSQRLPCMTRIPKLLCLVMTMQKLCVSFHVLKPHFADFQLPMLMSTSIFLFSPFQKNRTSFFHVWKWTIALCEHSQRDSVLWQTLIVCAMSSAGDDCETLLSCKLMLIDMNVIWVKERHYVALYTCALTQIKRRICLCIKYDWEKHSQWAWQNVIDRAQPAYKQLRNIDTIRWRPSIELRSFKSSATLNLVREKKLK